MFRSTQFDLSQYDGELSALAAEVGVDWNKAKSEIKWDEEWKNGLEATDSGSKGKVSLISAIKGRTRVITFHTKKHGGESKTWTSKNSGPVDSLVISRNKIRAQKHKVNKEKLYARLNQQYLAAWKSTHSEVDDDFKYLQAKKLSGVSLKVMTETLRKSKAGQKFIAVPVFNKNNMVGLQRIYENGEKAFTPGLNIRGSYYKIGVHTSEDDIIYLCEGWATAQTIHNITGKVVYCAFNAGNLIHVAEYLLKSHSSKQIIIAADNDRWKSYENAGLSKALDIHYQNRIKIRFPNVNGLDLDDKKPTDFNDLFCLAGLSETRHQLTKARKSVLSVPSTAFHYRIKKLSLAGKVKSPNNKNLRSCVAAGFRKGFSDKKITRLVTEANSSISEEMVLKNLRKLKAGHSRRVARCHTINPKIHPDVNFINLPLTRQDHGGYLIDDGFYDTIKDLNGVFVIKAPMASGKTETVIKKALDAANKGSYQAHRISLVEESSTRLGIQSYRDVSRLEMTVTNKLGCCINSLNNPKFAEGDWFLDADVVCIDEGTKVFHHLTGCTVENPEAVTDTLINAINVAKQVIICDADANDNLVELLSRHTNQKVHVAQASPRMDHVEVALTSLEDAYQHTINKALAGETVLCACDSKTDVERIKLAISERNKKVKVLDIFSETKIRPEVETWIKNPNLHSKNWDVVIYNSAVDSGVSVTTKHFQNQIGLFRGVISPDSVIQMMGRNRPAKTWYLGCSPIIATRYGDDVGERFKALAASNLKVYYEAEQKVVPLPQATIYDQIRLCMDYTDMLSRQDYLITLRLMLEQKGYRVEFKSTENDLLKKIREEMGELGQRIKDQFVEIILDATTPQPHRYRELKQSYAVSKEELAEIIRYEIRHNLGVIGIEEEDVRFWLNNGDRKELMFEIMQSDRQRLFKFDHWQMTNSSALTRRKHLLVKGDILHTLFDILNINRQTGEGYFTHHNCERFINFLLENKNRVRIWNYYSMGPYLSMTHRPKDPTKFVLGCLRKMGLATRAKLHGKERKSRHAIDEISWETISKYTELRKKAGKHISDLPFDVQKKEMQEAKEIPPDPGVTDSQADIEEEVSSTFHRLPDPEEYLCYDCYAPVDAVAVEFEMERCPDCRSRLIDSGG